MYRRLQDVSATPDWQEPGKRSTRSNPAIAPETEVLTTSPPQRDIHSAPAQSTGSDVASQFMQHYSSASYASQQFVHDHTTTPAEKAAIRIRDLQMRFLNGTLKEVEVEDEDGDTKKKIEVVSIERLDRRAAVDIYDQALDALSRTPSRHDQILVECKRKISVVLGTPADPKDDVFAANQLLKPLEPQYAEPRIDTAEDEDGYRAQWRLNAWRRDGWPKMYPVNAIKMEAEDPDEMLVGAKQVSDLRLRVKMLEDMSMWEDGHARSAPTVSKKKVVEKSPYPAEQRRKPAPEKSRKASEKKSSTSAQKQEVANPSQISKPTQPLAKKTSSPYKRIVVKDPPRSKKRGHERVEVYDTSDTTTSSDYEDDSEMEDGGEDEDDWD